MPPAERRQAILDAVVPLLLAHGRAVSTRQIAEASGIAEGTIFRVFHSKGELIDQVIARALAPGAVIDELRALPPRDDLRATVVDIVSTLTDHARTTHRLLALLPLDADALPHHGHDEASRREKGERTLDAIATAIAPHAGRLATSPEASAGPILAMSFGSLFATPSTDPDAVASILLYGLTKPEKG